MLKKNSKFTYVYTFNTKTLTCNTTDPSSRQGRRPTTHTHTHTQTADALNTAKIWSWVPEVLNVKTDWLTDWVTDTASCKENLVITLAQNKSGRSGEEKKFHHSPRWESNPGRPARSLVTILTELLDSIKMRRKQNISHFPFLLLLVLLIPMLLVFFVLFIFISSSSPYASSSHCVRTLPPTSSSAPPTDWLQ
jgi:hypothetical protein